MTDAGPGVPDAFVPHMFDRFTQASTGNTRTTQGVGVGLHIAEILATANGTHLHYRPVDPHGSCFELHVPRTSPGPDRPAERG